MKWKILVITMLVLSFFLQIGCNKYDNLKNTDLSNENINGIYLYDKYNSDAIEKKFGKVLNKVKGQKSDIYEYATEGFIVDLEVDKNNEIIKVSATGLTDNSIKTNKGINKSNSFAKVVQVYGENYFKENYSDFMGSGEGYSITYVDKNNTSLLQFEFNIQNGQERLSNISISKYGKKGK